MAVVDFDHFAKCGTTPKRHAFLDPRTIALLVAAMTAGSLWAEQPHARPYEWVIQSGGLSRDVRGWPFASTASFGAYGTHHYPSGEVANLIAIGALAVCVFLTTLHLGRWIAGRCRTSVGGILLVITTVAISCAVLLGRFDDVAYRLCRAVGLWPTGTEDYNLWLVYARVCLVYVACLCGLVVARATLPGMRRLHGA